MTKRYTILQKKLKELESQLNQVFSLQPDHQSSYNHQRFYQDIQQRFIFLKNLLYAEIVSSPRKPYHLQDIAQRLLELEAEFLKLWDSFQSLPADHVDKGSLACSCLESCLNDDGEEAADQGRSNSDQLMISYADLEQLAETASTELMSLAGLNLEGFDDEDHRVVALALPVENLESTSFIDETDQTETKREKITLEEEGGLVEEAEIKSMTRKEETNGVWFGKYLGTLATGVMLGMGLMAFFMTRFSKCFHCYASDYTFCLSPT